VGSLRLTALYLVIAPLAPYLSLATYVPLLVLVVRRVNPPGDPDTWTKLAVAGFALFLLLVLFSWVAWYLPIFKPGSVV
jgi:hypothetical protein